MDWTAREKLAGRVDWAQQVLHPMALNPKVGQSTESRLTSSVPFPGQRQSYIQALRHYVKLMGKIPLKGCLSLKGVSHQAQC